MSELLTVALVCAHLLNTSDCSRETAIDVIVAPAKNPIECLRQGQAIVAQTGMAADGDVYVKVACERRRVASATVDQRD